MLSINWAILETDNTTNVCLTSSCVTVFCLFLKFAEEISRQLINSNAKVIFGLTAMSSVLQEAVKMAKRAIRIIYVKETQAEAIPAEGVDFSELISTQGKELLSFYFRYVKFQ